MKTAEMYHSVRFLVPTILLLTTWTVYSPAQVQPGYYVISNDGSVPNTATVLKLDPKNGQLSVSGVFHTGGQGGYQNTDGEVTMAVSPNGSCLFVADVGSSDIAAFSRTGRVGNYSSSNLVAEHELVLAENPSGNILYAGYFGSENLAVWTINSDCSLSLANTYPTSGPEGLENLTVTHDGTTLLGTFGATDPSSYVDSWTISGTGLVDNGAVLVEPWGNGVSKIVATDDNKMVLMSIISNSITGPDSAIITANLPGFTNQQMWEFDQAGAVDVAMSRDANTGKGCVYLAENGIGDGSGGWADPPGIMGVQFQESPLTLSAASKASSADPKSAPRAIQRISNRGNSGGVYALATPVAGYAVEVYSADANCRMNYVSSTLLPNQGDINNLIVSWAPLQ